MRILDRYLMKGFLKAFFFCAALFLILFTVIDSFNNLDEFIKHSVSFHVILSYYFYLLPVLFVQIVPVATLVAILFVLGNLNRHNEIIALKASGVSSSQIIVPYLFLGLLTSFLVFWVSESFVPSSAVTSRAIMDGLILKGKKNLEERAIKNVTLFGKGNRMIFAREYQILSQSLHDIVILENNEDQMLKSKLIAKKAQHENGQWVFYDTMYYRLNRRGEMTGDPVYEPKRALDMPEKPEDFIKEASQVEFMSAKQLKEYIDQLKGSGRKLLRRLWVDFHYKVAFPFVTFIVMLVGAPLAMRIERASAMVGIGTSLVIVILYYGIDSVCLALGKGGFLPPLAAAWFANLLFAGVGIYLLKKIA